MMLKTGIVGTLITAICCFTPVLVWLLTAVGLAAAIPFVDLWLIPLLIVFIFLTLFAFLRRSKEEA